MLRPIAEEGLPGRRSSLSGNEHLIAVLLVGELSDRVRHPVDDADRSVGNVSVTDGFGGKLCSDLFGVLFSLLDRFDLTSERGRLTESGLVLVFVGETSEDDLGPECFRDLDSVGTKLARGLRVVYDNQISVHAYNLSRRQITFAPYRASGLTGFSGSSPRRALTKSEKRVSRSSVIDASEYHAAWGLAITSG